GDGGSRHRYPDQCRSVGVEYGRGGEDHLKAALCRLLSRLLDLGGGPPDVRHGAPNPCPPPHNCPRPFPPRCADPAHQRPLPFLTPSPPATARQSILQATSRPRSTRRRPPIPSLGCPSTTSSSHRAPPAPSAAPSS